MRLLFVVVVVVVVAVVVAAVVVIIIIIIVVVVVVVVVVVIIIIAPHEGVQGPLKTFLSCMEGPLVYSVRLMLMFGGHGQNSLQGQMLKTCMVGQLT